MVRGGAAARAALRTAVRIMRHYLPHRAARCSVTCAYFVALPLRAHSRHSVCSWRALYRGTLRRIDRKRGARVTATTPRLLFLSLSAYAHNSLAVYPASRLRTLNNITLRSVRA